MRNEPLLVNGSRFKASEPEYLLTEDDILISATDAKGIITFADNRFYEIAEYQPGESVGRPHNIIRHPDMPKTAFADRWAVIQAGKTWQGYVKNRAKNGHSYWVKANDFPCFENGKIVGYISIRTKPDRARINQAIDAYRRVP
jgi:PAS domain S-box-containing protein